MVSLTQSRFGLEAPRASAPQQFAGPDTTTASAIQAFGEIGGDAYRGYREGQLLNELQDTGNMIATINAGTDAIRDAVKQGNIDPTSKRFQQLAAATQQGKISQQRASIEAEVILRESIARAPGFADNFRQTAREVLGFDPSSATLGTLFGSGPDANKTKPLTQMDKDMQQAEAMVAGGAFRSPEAAFQAIQQERAAGIRQRINTAKIQGGNLNAGQVAVEGATRARDSMNNVMIGAFAQVGQAGGVVDIEQMRGALMSQADQIKSQIEGEMAQSEAYRYTPEHYNQVRQRIDEQRDSYIQILDNQDLTKVLSTRTDRMNDLMEQMGVKAAPHLAMLTHFPEAVQEAVIDMMIQSGGDPRIAQEMAAADPRVAFSADVMTDVMSIAPAMTALVDGTLETLIQSGGVDKKTVQGVAQSQGAAYVDGHPSAVDIGKIFKGLKDADLPKTSLDMIAKASNRAYTDLSEEDRQVVAQDINIETSRQMSAVNRTLQSAQGQGFRLAWDDNKGFTIVDTLGRSPREVLGPFAPTGFISPEAEQDFIQRNSEMTAEFLGVQEALGFVNKSLVPIMKDQRWAKAVGYEDGNQWATDQINKMNLSALAPEVEQGGPILESMDMATQAEFRKAFRNGDLQTALKIMSNVDASRVGDQGVQAFQTGGNLTGVPFQAQQTAADLPAYQGNQLVPGLTREAQAVAQFEGAHDPADPNWDGKTVGYGLDLETNPRAKAIIDELGLKGQSNEQIAQYFQDNPEVAVEMLNREVALHKEELIKKIPEIGQLDDVRQETMANLAYNLGVTKLSGFKNMVQAIKDGDFKKARRELITTTGKDGTVRLTKWVKDVKAKRAATLALALQTGQWPSEEQVAQVEAMIQNALDNS